MDAFEVLLREHWKGHSTVTTSMEDFKIWVNDMELIDLPLLKEKYTWHRNNQAIKIHRAFVDGEWLELFKYLKLLGLDRSISDHCPLPIDCESESWGPKPFRNLDVWLYFPKRQEVY